MITVFTPTYNRGYIIESLYRSLQKQTFRDFEWIVVDDGSTDSTEALFAKFLEEDNDFKITYIKKENGGKHRAINIGLDLAKGDLFFIVDSDDSLPPHSLQKIREIEKTIPEKEKHHFGGVCGLKGYSPDKIVGRTFDGDYLDITSLDRDKYHITGDKSEVFYTDVLRKFKFPEFDGENFVTECVVWDKIAFEGYLLRFFNDIVYICDYLPDGLTAQGASLLWKNPKGYGLYLSQCGRFGKLFGVEKWNTYFRYYQYMRNKVPFSQIAKNLCCHPIVFWFRIFGMKIYFKIYDK